jgi:hypothetical protein
MLCFEASEAQISTKVEVYTASSAVMRCAAAVRVMPAHLSHSFKRDMFSDSWLCSRHITSPMRPAGGMPRLLDGTKRAAAEDDTDKAECF